MRSEKNARRGGLLILLLGGVLMLCGALVLAAVPNGFQYILPAPHETQEGGALAALYERGTEELAEMGDVLTRAAIAARWQSAGILAGGGNRSVTATVYAVGAGYFDAVHERLLQGRFVSETDVRQAERMIVLDSAAALTLFPGVDPIGQKVLLSGVECEVAGVIRGGRRVGEVDEHIAYIPITMADAQSLPVQTVAFLARGVNEIGAAILMRDTLSAREPGGSFYSLSKLKLGAVMPLRWLALIVGVMFLMALLRRLNARAWSRVCYFAQELRLRYAYTLLPAMIAQGALYLLAYAALLGAALLLARFSIAPLLVFTEWVPEVVVELSSLTSRFWSLNAQNAAVSRYVSREVCAIELGQGLLRWGLMAALLGLAVRGIPWLGRRVPLEPMKKER